MDQQILQTGQIFFNDLLIIIRENPCQSVADKKITETVQLTHNSITLHFVMKNKSPNGHV